MASLSLSADELAALADQVAGAIAARLPAENGNGKPREKLLYNEKEAAGILGVSGLTLKQWRVEGKIKAHTTKRPILYAWGDIERVAEWLKNRN